MNIRSASLMTRASALAVLAADDAAAAAKPADSKAPKALTVADDMEARRVFANSTDAAAYLNACAEKFSDFATTPLAFPGSTDEGDFDPAVYTDSTAVMVGTLRKAKEGVKCVYILPIPTTAQLLADEGGKAWIERILLKELSHVGVRALREAEDITTVVDQMPTTMEGFISTARESGGIMETFNELYKDISAVMGQKVPTWAKFRLTKQDLKRAFESKPYAAEYYPALETRPEGKESMFVVALKLGAAFATKKGLDATIFNRWIESRDAKTFEANDEAEFDFDAILADPKTEEAAAA